MTSASHSHTPNSKDWCQTTSNTPNACPKDFSSLTLTPNPQAALLCSLSNTNTSCCLFGSSARQRQSEALQLWIGVPPFGRQIRKKLPEAAGALEPIGKLNAYRKASVAISWLQITQNTIQIHFVYQSCKQSVSLVLDRKFSIWF